MGSPGIIQNVGVLNLLRQFPEQVRESAEICVITRVLDLPVPEQTFLRHLREG